MKKLFFSLLGLFALACSSNDDPEVNPTPDPETTLRCEILSPVAESRHDLNQPLVIQCDGESPEQSPVTQARLKIGNRIVASSSELPFSYTHTFAEDQSEGEVEITLTVENSAGKSASDKVKITTYRSHDTPQVLTCSIVAPVDGQEVNPDEPLAIRCEASADWGEITRAVLEIGGQEVYASALVPFTYTHTFDADQAEGEVELLLTVTGEEENTQQARSSILLKRPEPKPQGVTYVVAKDGSGDYYTVQEAINATKSNSSTRQVIYIKPGTYKEKITIESNRPYLTLVGEDAATTILTYDDYAGKDNLGTQNSASFTLKATDFMAVNLTFENPHQNLSSDGAQAVAVGAYNDRAAFYNCRLVGYQDTFYAKNAARVYCKDCYIEGNVDFIFGDATLLCQDCQLHCNRNNSVLTAAADHSNAQYGFVFMDCTITHVEGQDFAGSTFNTFYLGRPWKQGAKVVFIRCDEPSKLNAAGWCRMSEGVEASLFAEYQCTGAGAAADRLTKREMGGRQLTESEASAYTLSNIFSAAARNYSADWIPEAKFVLVK